MINALASVPFVVLGAGVGLGPAAGWRPSCSGALALACQVFAGHLQDAS